jgi:hypothetical protein
VTLYVDQCSKTVFFYTSCFIIIFAVTWSHSAGGRCVYLRETPGKKGRIFKLGFGEKKRKTAREGLIVILRRLSPWVLAIDEFRQTYRESLLSGRRSRCRIGWTRGSLVGFGHSKAGSEIFLRETLTQILTQIDEAVFPMILHSHRIPSSRP